MTTEEFPPVLLVAAVAWLPGPGACGGSSSVFLFSPVGAGLRAVNECDESDVFEASDLWSLLVALATCPASGEVCDMSVAPLGGSDGVMSWEL